MSGLIASSTLHPDSDDALVETSEDERERHVDKLKINCQITSVLKR